MNTQESIDRRFVMLLSILLAAILLPLSTFAQDANNPMNDCAPGEISVGFGETDPSAPLFHAAQTGPSIPSYQTQMENVGFAEMDPAAQLSLDTVSVQQVTANQLQNGFVGFAETDPSVTDPSSSERAYSRDVACLGKNGRHAALELSNLSSLTETHSRMALDYLK